MSGGYPLLVLDMWEHAWYLKHKHRRHLYAADWWMLVDWNQVFIYTFTFHSQCLERID